MQHISDTSISDLWREVFSTIIREYDDKIYTFWVLSGGAMKFCLQIVKTHKQLNSLTDLLSYV